MLVFLLWGSKVWCWVEPRQNCGNLLDSHDGGRLAKVPSYWCVLRRVAGWVAGGCWDDYYQWLWVIPENSLLSTSKKNLSGPKGKPLCHPCCLLGHGSARSQLVSSTNPALSTIAASVLNDKAGMTIFQRYFRISQYISMIFHDETGACDLCQDHFHRPS